MLLCTVSAVRECSWLPLELAINNIFFNTAPRLNYVTRSLLLWLRNMNGKLQAWAIFSNHYHFIAEAKRAAEFAPVINICTPSPRSASIFWMGHWSEGLVRILGHAAHVRKGVSFTLNYVHTNP